MLGSSGARWSPPIARAPSTRTETEATWHAPRASTFATSALTSLDSTVGACDPKLGTLRLRLGPIFAKYFVQRTRVQTGVNPYNLPLLQSSCGFQSAHTFLVAGKLDQ